MKSVRDVAVLVVAMILQATFLYRFEIAGIPSGDNPKTGRIVAMSILHTILMRRAPLVVG